MKKLGITDVWTAPGYLGVFALDLTMDSQRAKIDSVQFGGFDTNPMRKTVSLRLSVTEREVLDYGKSNASHFTIRKQQGRKCFYLNQENLKNRSHLWAIFVEI